MRNITGSLINNAKFHFPSRIIISGSSGTGKTSMVFKLIQNQHFSKPIRKVFYFSCLGSNNLEWHNQLPDVDVNYMDGMPTSDFFENICPNSIGLFYLKINFNIIFLNCSYQDQICRRHSKPSDLPKSNTGNIVNLLPTQSWSS